MYHPFRAYGRFARRVSGFGDNLATQSAARMGRTMGATYQANRAGKSVGNFIKRHPHMTIYGGIGAAYSVTGNGGLFSWPGRHATSQPGGRMRGTDPRTPYSSGTTGLISHSTGGYA